jgi:hypothetical protein
MQECMLRMKICANAKGQLNKVVPILDGKYTFCVKTSNVPFEYLNIFFSVNSPHLSKDVETV